MSVKLNEGDVFESSVSGPYIIKSDLGFDKVEIMFLKTKFEKTIKRSQVKTGRIKDPYHPLVFGVGFHGCGEHKATENGKPTRKYRVWEGMIKRCYSANVNSPSRYIGRGVKVCDEWLNYQNFGDWFDKQEHSSRKGFELDKDILNPLAKEYSPQNCAFIPKYLNTILTASNAKRGALPVGVCGFRNGFMAQCSRDGERVRLGVFKSSSDAFEAYRSYKLELIKEKSDLALKGGHISKKIHEKLLSVKILPFPE